jgi:small subunit ribosomal protein S21
MKPYNKRPYDNNRQYDKKPFVKRPKEEGLMVNVRDGEPIEKALRRLKKKMINNKVLETVREKQFYTKPSEKRKQAKAAAVARWKKQQKKNEDRY